MESCFEEVIGRLFEGRQHERAVLHFGDAESRNTQNFSLEAHDVTQQHGMSSIDSKTVRLHSLANLVRNGSSGGFNTKNGEDVQDVIGYGLLADDTCKGTISFRPASTADTTHHRSS